MKITLVTVLGLIASFSAFADIPRCEYSLAEPSIIRNITENLGAIDPGLDLSTVEIIRRPRTTNFRGIKHYEYWVSVRDRHGERYTLSTFMQDRKTERLKKRVGGLFVSDVVVTTPNLIPFNGSSVSSWLNHSSCDTQYLSFTSLWGGGTLYATRLFDSKGRVVNPNAVNDVFDRSLRASSDTIGPNTSGGDDEASVKGASESGDSGAKAADHQAAGATQPAN